MAEGIPKVSQLARILKQTTGTCSKACHASKASTTKPAARKKKKSTSGDSCQTNRNATYVLTASIQITDHISSRRNTLLLPEASAGPTAEPNGNEILRLNLMSSIPVPAMFFGEACFRKADYSVKSLTFFFFLVKFI